MSVPIGISDDVAYRLKALDKRQLRWPALHLFIAVSCAATLYVIYASAK